MRCDRRAPLSFPSELPTEWGSERCRLVGLPSGWGSERCRPSSLPSGWGSERCRPVGLPSGWGQEWCRPVGWSWRSCADERTGESAASNRRKYEQTDVGLPSRTRTDKQPLTRLPLRTRTDKRPLTRLPLRTRTDKQALTRLPLPEGLERQTDGCLSIRTLPDWQTAGRLLVRTQGSWQPAWVYVVLTLPPRRALTSRPVASQAANQSEHGDRLSRVDDGRALAAALGVGRQCLFQLIGQSEVIDDQSALLVADDADHSGDGNAGKPSSFRNALCFPVAVLIASSISTNSP